MTEVTRILDQMQQGDPHAAALLLPLVYEKLRKRADDLLALDEALTALAREEPDKAELVTLRYFAGLTLDEAAACLGVSLATVKRRWAVARAWLYDAVSSGAPPQSQQNP